MCACPQGTGRGTRRCRLHCGMWRRMTQPLVLLEDPEGQQSPALLRAPRGRPPMGPQRTLRRRRLWPCSSACTSFHCHTGKGRFYQSWSSNNINAASCSHCIPLLGGIHVPSVPARHWTGTTCARVCARVIGKRATTGLDNEAGSSGFEVYQLALTSDSQS